MIKKKLTGYEFHILWTNGTEQKIKLLTTDKERAKEIIEENKSFDVDIDKIYSLSKLFSVNYIDDEVICDE